MLAVGSSSSCSVYINPCQRDDCFPIRRKVKAAPLSQNRPQKVVRGVLREQKCPHNGGLQPKVLKTHVHIHIATDLYKHTHTICFKCLISNPALLQCILSRNNKSLNRNSACARRRVMEIIREHHCSVFIFCAWVLCVPVHKCLRVCWCKTSFGLSRRCGPWSR